HRQIVSLAGGAVVAACEVGCGVVFDGVPAGAAEGAVCGHRFVVTAGRAAGRAHLTKEVVGGEWMGARRSIVSDAERRAGDGAEVVRKRGAADGGVVGRGPT